MKYFALVLFAFLRAGPAFSTVTADSQSTTEEWTLPSENSWGANGSAASSEAMSQLATHTLSAESSAAGSSAGGSTAGNVTSNVHSVTIQSASVLTNIISTWLITESGADLTSSSGGPGSLSGPGTTATLVTNQVAGGSAQSFLATVAAESPSGLGATTPLVANQEAGGSAQSSTATVDVGSRSGSGLTRPLVTNQVVGGSSQSSAATIGAGLRSSAVWRSTEVTPRSALQTGSTAHQPVSPVMGNLSTVQLNTTTRKATTFPSGPGLIWLRILDPPSAFIESRNYSLTCAGSLSGFGWMLGSSYTEPEVKEIGTGLYSSILNFTASRDMHSKLLRCMHQSVNVSTDNSLTMKIFWGPSFGDTARRIRMQSRSNKTYFALCGGLSSNPSAQYSWITASKNGSFNDSGSIAIHTSINLTDNEIQLYQSPVFAINYYPSQQSPATCQALNPATGLLDSIEVYFIEASQGRLDYALDRRDGTYFSGQNMSITCSSSSPSRLRRIGVLSASTRYSLIECSAGDDRLYADEDAVDSRDVRVTFEGASSRANTPMKSCSGFPWDSNSTISVTFIFTRVTQWAKGHYVCFAIEEDAGYSEFARPGLWVAPVGKTGMSLESIIQSAIFALEVYGLPDRPRIFAPTILVEGSSGTLSCVCKTLYTYTVLKWVLISQEQTTEVQNLGGRISTSYKPYRHVVHSTVTITVTRVMDGAVIMCYIASHPTGLNYSNTAILSVAHGPVISNAASFALRMERNATDPVTLACKVDSKPAAEIWWYASGVVVPRHFYSSNGEAFAIPLQFRHPGGTVYDCRAFNKESGRTAAATIRIIWLWPATSTVHGDFQPDEPVTRLKVRVAAVVIPLSILCGFILIAVGVFSYIFVFKTSSTPTMVAPAVDRHKQPRAVNRRVHRTKVPAEGAVIHQTFKDKEPAELAQKQLMSLSKESAEVAKNGLPPLGKEPAELALNRQTSLCKEPAKLSLIRQTSEPKEPTEIALNERTSQSKDPTELSSRPIESRVVDSGNSDQMPIVGSQPVDLDVMATQWFSAVDIARVSDGPSGKKLADNKSNETAHL